MPNREIFPRALSILSHSSIEKVVCHILFVVFRSLIPFLPKPFRKPLVNCVHILIDQYEPDNNRNADQAPNGNSPNGVKRYKIN